jgi:hypothetical protein
MKTPSHLPADLMIKLSKIPRRTFYNQIISKEIDFIQMYRSQRLYSVKDWNKKNPDYQIDLTVD